MPLLLLFLLLLFRERAACDVLRGGPRTTRDDPEFMGTYYRSSRLHFIGRWKARIEALSLRAAPSGPRPKPSPPLRGGLCCAPPPLIIELHYHHTHPPPPPPPFLICWGEVVGSVSESCSVILSSP